MKRPLRQDVECCPRLRLWYTSREALLCPRTFSTHSLRHGLPPTLSPVDLAYNESLGSLVPRLRVSSRQLNQQLEGWADEFGGDFELAIFGKRVVFVTGPEDARRMNHQRPTKFLRGWFEVRNRAVASLQHLRTTAKCPGRCSLPFGNVAMGDLQGERLDQ